jgi:hypothetical protein
MHRRPGWCSYFLTGPNDRRGIGLNQADTVLTVEFPNRLRIH